MSKKKRNKPKKLSKPRNWEAVSAWNRKAGPHEDKRKKIEKKRIEQEIKE